MTQTVYVVALCIVTVAFWWFAVIVLNFLNIMLTRIGAAVHKFLDLPKGEEKDAWLFALLVGITKYPTTALATGSFFFAVLGYIVDVPWVVALRAMFVAAFLILFVVRLVGVLMGSVIFGTSMRTIISSLQT